MANENDKLVVAYYVNEAAAEAAAEDLKAWDKGNDEVELGAFGIITLKRETGEIEVRDIGQRDTKKGALWGTAIGAAAGILTAGIALIPGMIVGAAVGAGIGALDHKSLGMTDEDVANLAEHLKHGGAALGVMADDFEVAPTMARLVQEGGRPEQYDLDSKTAVEIYDAAKAQAKASAAVNEAVGGEGVAMVLAATGADEEEVSKLSEAGVDKASALLEMGATLQGRHELAEETGIAEETILTAVKKMDLMRIDGVGTVYTELLQASGVETVPDLARRNPANLSVKLADVNESEAITEDLPGEEQVTDWVAQAKELPRVIEY